MDGKQAEIALEPGREAVQAPRFLPLITISVRFTAPPHTDRCIVLGVISNMSETGACIITNRPLPVGATARLGIGSPVPHTRLEPIDITARIVWCSERFEPMKEIVGFLTGVSFDSAVVEDARRLLGSGAFQAVL